MFTVDQRSRIRAALVERANQDPAISGAALVGSAARDAEDMWSDIDLVLQLAPDADEPGVAREWSDYLGRLSPIADRFDLYAGGIRYRVYLLESSLQVDLSFWPYDQFHATEAPFRILFGTPGAPTEPGQPDMDRTFGMGWLFVLHARSAVARGRLWQATMMLDELRNSVVTLMCIRSGLPYWHGRGVDNLSRDERSDLELARATRVNAADLDESRRRLAQLFLDEIRRADEKRADRLRPAFDELANPLPRPESRE
jgi:predicted nucleotidyltransferase